MNFKEQLKIDIQKTLSKLNIQKELNEIIIEVPKVPVNGDYSTNVALTLSSILHSSPRQIAEQILDNFQSDIVKKIEIAGPGFINFFMKEDYLFNILNDVITMDKNYGRSNIGSGKKINVEYVSVNPTGIMHVGHGRGATYGDNLSRILSFTGYDVTKEYFINDAGNQMYNLGISIKERYKELLGMPSSLPEDGYHGKEIITIASEIKEKYQDTKINEEIEFFKQYGLKYLLNQIKVDLDKYRVNFDVWTSEQTLYDLGRVEEVMTSLRKSNNCYINENALWLKTTPYGDEKDRVLVKSDGNYTYLVPDIAYHAYKYSRNFDELIDILGADHHGYVPRLKASLEILGYDTSKLDVKILQMVRIIKDGEEIKLSKRTGKTITLNDLIDEAGVNATRYFFSSKSIDTQMDFNLDIATKENNENPVYYIEYANARISSILRKNKEYKIESKEKYMYLDNELTYNILNKLCEFKDVVENASNKRLPHLIANYVYELAGKFHNYYSNVQIVTDNKEETEEHLLLIKAIKIVINNSLNLLGIIPRDEM